MKLKRILLTTASLCVVALIGILMLNKPMSADDKLLRENIEALAGGGGLGGIGDGNGESGKAICYSSCDGQLEGHEYLACVECVFKPGIAGARGGYCKW